MKFSYDYESVLLGFSLSLSLFSYIFRRNYLRKKNHEFFPFKKILKRKENIFLLSASAWLLFSFYMLLTIGSNLQGFYEKESFFTDIIFVLFPLYCAYHEYVAWRNRRDFSGLRFINGLFSISMLIYLVVYSIPPLAGAVVYFSAYQSAALLTFFGYHTQASSVDFGGNNGLLRENELYISSELLRKGRDNLIDVNLTCSAFPSHVIFLALILLSERELKTKLRALIIIPIVHFLNVLRISALVYVLYTGKMSYFLAHDIMSRLLTLVALFFLFSYLFKLLPDVHKDFLNALSIHRKHKLS